MCKVPWDFVMPKEKRPNVHIYVGVKPLGVVRSLYAEGLCEAPSVYRLYKVSRHLAKAPV